MVFFFDSHPVQYKAPVYRRLAELKPGSFKVIYATDCSVRGHLDREFGEVIAWNTPLLEGYDFLVLNNEHGKPLEGFRSLTGKGVDRLLRAEKPQAAILCEFIYAFDFAAYFSCLRQGIPIWIRQETQDDAVPRPVWKTELRTIFYRLLYLGVQHAFYFGVLNRHHLLRHGIPEKNLTRTPFCTPDPPVTDGAEKQRRREAVRARFGIPADKTLLLFSGKWIEKKNPLLILEALERLSIEERSRFQVLFIGSGILAPALRDKAAAFPDCVHFGGLVNQAEIFDFYLAADLLLLPSNRAGETWGLVVNEALQAGCGVIMTEAVGCYPEFGEWERVRVVPIGDAAACADALRDLVRFPRDFDWCAESLHQYSVEAAAAALAQQIGQLESHKFDHDG